MIKCASVGASAGLASVGALLLAAKLAGFEPLLCLLGLLAVPIGGAVCFALTHESARRLSRRMDDDLELEERVQTMLEFDGAGGAMIELQRRDTEKRLSDIPVGRLKFRRAWLFILLPVLSVSLLVGAVICPEAAEPEEPPMPEEPPRDITEWEWQALDELIEYVRASDADGDIMKPETLASLEGLRSLLLRGVSESSLSVFVSSVATDINNIATRANEADISEQQKLKNTALAEYTVSKLYEIFGLSKPVVDDGDGEEDDGGDGSGNGEQNSDGFGGISMAAKDELFDPEKGYVPYGEVIDERQADIEQAMRDGVLSDEEWETVMETYFGHLRG